MKPTAIFFASTTGNTESVARLIQEELHDVPVYYISETSVEELSSFNNLILGTSTWSLGEMEEVWADFLPGPELISLKGKSVSLFGLGDQLSYPDTFVDRTRVLYDTVKKQGAAMVGFWKSEGYEFEDSKAVENGKLVGLVIDEDNQHELTKERVKEWVMQLTGELS